MNAPAEWSRLTRIPCWTPLARIGCESHQLKDALFRIGPNCYVTAGEYDADLSPSPSRRVGSLLWAESDGAALRAVNMEIEADALCPGGKIPSEMLLPGRPRTYGEILSAFRTGRHGSFMEHADYRIARDGAFIHRALDGPDFVFYFRSLVEKPSEIPYAIMRRLDDPLRGRRWVPASRTSGLSQ